MTFWRAALRDETKRCSLSFTLLQEGLWVMIGLELHFLDELFFSKSPAKSGSCPPLIRRRTERLPRFWCRTVGEGVTQREAGTSASDFEGEVCRVPLRWTRDKSTW